MSLRVSSPCESKNEKKARVEARERKREKKVSFKFTKAKEKESRDYDDDDDILYFPKPGDEAGEIDNIFDGNDGNERIKEPVFCPIGNIVVSMSYSIHLTDCTLQLNSVRQRLN